MLMQGYKGWKFLDFSLISDFFTWTILKIIFEVSSEERLSHDIILDPGEVLVLFQTFSLNLTYIPV